MPTIISTKGRYGVKAVFDLALHENGTPVALNDIARRQDISEAYLEQLFAVLRRAQIITSTRGASGGYQLARSPDQISVGDIIHALEGPMTPADCVLDGEGCQNASGCAVRVVWGKVHDSVNQVIDSITLKDMLNQDSALFQDEAAFG